MKRNDDILRYLSDFMSEKEKLEFEKELSFSEELRNQVAQKKSILEKMNALTDIKEDSPYFQNLLPRVRAKIEKKKSTVWVPRWAYLLVSTTAVILIVVNISRFGTGIENGSKKTIQEKQAEPVYIEYSLNNDNVVKSDIELVNAENTDKVNFEIGISQLSNTNKESLKELSKYQRIMWNVDNNSVAYNSGY
jgi:hypothetical protein